MNQAVIEDPARQNPPGHQQPAGQQLSGKRSETRPFASFERLISFRYLRPPKGEGFISVIAILTLLGIALGVTALIVVLSVMNGFRDTLYKNILDMNGHVVVQQFGQAFTDFDPVANKIKQVKGVKSVIPVIDGQVMVSSKHQDYFGNVRGIREGDLNSLASVAGKIRFGSLKQFQNKDSVVLGIRLANVLGVRPGDTINIVTLRGAKTPFGTTPRVKRYKVSAIFEVGVYEYDLKVMFMPLTEAQKFFSQKQRVSALEVMVNDPKNVELIENDIAKASGDNTTLTSWKQRNAKLFSVLAVERNMMFIIVSLVVFVAALNIISSMVMLVKVKTKDIAVLRTMGASRGAIMRIFMTTGSFIGVCGTVLGLLLGLTICLNIDAIQSFISWLTGVRLDPEIQILSKLPAKLDAMEISIIVTVALFLSFLATIYPAWRAASLDPVEALRYE